MMKRICFLSLLLTVVPIVTGALSPEPSKTGSEVEGLISWLLQDGRDLSGIPFSEVVHSTAGVKVLPVDPADPDDQRIVEKIGTAMDAVLSLVNDPGHSIHEVGRINEVSGHLEAILLDELNAIDGFRCTVPTTAAGSPQRAGYPDLRLLDQSSGRIFYLDPKLYAEGSERSTFRTFYFEPKTETNKILDDASHIIVGVAHGGRSDDGSWIFLRWNLVDLHDFEVRLKAEFQASNRDLYRPAAIIGQSEGKEKEPARNQ